MRWTTGRKAGLIFLLSLAGLLHADAADIAGGDTGKRPDVTVADNGDGNVTMSDGIAAETTETLNKLGIAPVSFAPMRNTSTVRA